MWMTYRSKLIGVSRIDNNNMITGDMGAPLERYFPAKKMAARGGHLQNARTYLSARFM